MMRSTLILVLLLVGFQFATAVSFGKVEQYPPIKTPSNVTNFGRGISRTMHLLATSTPERRNTVKILVYGQSITRGSYWLDLKAFLEQSYPHANIIMENLAIGGFSVPLLSLPAEQDVFPFYPDLIIFHVYGPEPDYEDLIRSFRRRTSAEIAIQNDHVTPNDNAAWEQHHSFEWLPALCETYGLQLLDIRHPWEQYLAEYHINASLLLIDGTHPNQWGNWLMGTIIKWYLRYDPSFPVDPYGLSTTFTVGKDVKWQNGKIKMQINGNRVDLIATNPLPKTGAKTAKILIDGQPPSSFPECYTCTRPNFETADTTTDWPWDIGAVVRVDHYVPLLEEDWKLTFTSINPSVTNFNFSVEGSVTGQDGNGNNTQYFVSKSGRAMFKPNYWFITQANSGPYKVNFKPGYEIKWKSTLMGTDTYTVPQVSDPTLEYATTVAQGLINMYHQLEITVDDPQELPISEIRVYRPPLEHW